ncbi:MAG: hypothetical protein Kow00121_62080 [Elainellaceae cyanobacterium]
MQFKFQPLVRKSFAFTVGICLGIIPLAPQAQAALTMNGESINGLTFNGHTLNGIRFNGLVLDRTVCLTSRLSPVDSNCSPTEALYLEGGQLVGLPVMR